MKRRSFITLTATTAALTGLQISSSLAHAKIPYNNIGGDILPEDDQIAGNRITLKTDRDTKQFFVSPAGDDSNAGTRESPFKTLSHVRNKVREWNLSSGNENIVVWMSGGEYRLSETMVFGLNDSAKPGQAISYRALPGERPVISSDILISGWKKLQKVPKGLPEKANGKLWVTRVPASVSSFKVLFNSQGMLPRARTGAIAHLRKSDDWMGTAEMHTTIPFRKETVGALFNPMQAEIVVIGAAPWTMNILPVKSVDAASGMVYLGAASTYALAEPRYYFGPKTIWVENTFAGLDSPGKWVFDEQQGLLYLWPPDDEKPGNDIVVPRLGELIRVEGKINYEETADEPVRGLTFKGLTFTHGNRFDFSGRTGRGLQHDWERFDAATALLRFRGAEDCLVEQCNFIFSGGAGIRFDLYARRNKVLDNKMTELGGAGILLAGYGPGTKDVNRYNEICNNQISHVGRIWWHSLGIWAWQSGYNLISHNTIHHVPYTAIAVTGRINWDKTGKGECSRTVRWSETGDFNGRESWIERERFLHGRGNHIEQNDIHHVMEVMQDGNGVYISGAGIGNFIHKNFVHDTPTISAGEGIRCDDDQHETLVESNIVFRYGALGTGICSKGRNHIINNIIACPPNQVKRGLLSLEPASSKSNMGGRIFHNIFYTLQPDQPFIYQDGMKQSISCIEIDRNIYFNASNAKAADEYLEWARREGGEINSLQADPLFSDAKNGDFRLKPNSPAIQVGFRPIKLDPGRIKSLQPDNY